MNDKPMPQFGVRTASETTLPMIKFRLQIAVSTILFVFAGARVWATNDFYVVDYSTGAIVKFDGETGDLLGNFASAGASSRPGWLACAPNGNILMTLQNGSQVAEFDNATGAFVGVFTSTHMNNPTGLTLGPNGNLFVTNRDSFNVVEFDGRTGAFVDIFASGLPGLPFALAFGPNGNLFVALGTGADSVVELDGTTGAQLRAFPTAGRPRGLTFGPNGGLYVSLLLTNTVAEFDIATGALVRTLSGGLNSPHGLRFDSSGNLFVVSLNTGQVVEFDTASGALIGPVVTSGLSVPVGLLIGSSSGPCSSPIVCSGFQSPLASGPVTVRKNRALPVKAELFDSDGFPITDFEIVSPPVIEVSFTPTGSSDVIDVSDEALNAGQGTEGNQFVFSEELWRFNLKIKNYTAPGTYSIMMRSGDATEYVVDSCSAQFVVEP